MNNKILIDVKGTTEESGVVEVNCEGRYAMIREVEYIKYEEVLEDADIIIKNMIKLKKGAVEIIKKGPMNSHMTFIPGKVTECVYDTPYGKIPMEVHTKSVNIIRTQDRLRVVLEYELGMGETQKIPCSVDINIINA